MRRYSFNVPQFFSSGPILFTSCNKNPTIKTTGVKIKYPAIGDYSPNEKCEWTINAGKVNLSFSSMDLDRGLYDFVAIEFGQAIVKWGKDEYEKKPDKYWIVEGIITIKFESDRSSQHTGFLLNIDTMQLQIVQLQNPTQSSTNTGSNCAGNKCPASAAIDGDLATMSVTRHGSAEWWQVEMMKTTLIDHIMIHPSGWAMSVGFYNK